MRTPTLSLALAATFGAAPVFAQSADKSAEAVAEAVEEAAEAAESASDGQIGSASTAPVAQAAPPINSAAEVLNTGQNRPRPPRLKRYRFIGQADYPIAAWNAGEEGSLEYDAAVNSEGKPTTCKITKSSGSVRLDEAFCPLLMKHAEFRPGTDEAGEAVARIYQSEYTWRKKEPEAPEMSLIFQYTHGADGVTSDCKFLKMENLPEKMRRDIEKDRERGKLCPGSGNKRGTPYRDENGVPVAKLVTVELDVVLEDVPAP
jgi:TonB family protein